MKEKVRAAHARRRRIVLEEEEIKVYLPPDERPGFDINIHGRVKIEEEPASFNTGSSVAYRIRVLTPEEWARLNF